MSDKTYDKEFFLRWGSNNELVLIMQSTTKTEEIAFDEETAYEIFKFLKEKFRHIVKNS